MKKNLLISFSLVLILVVGMVFLSRDDSSFEDVANTPANVYIQNGVQYVVINARAGYTPRISSIDGGMPTKLIVKTKDTYDCSSALVIRSVGYRNMLPANGETIIDLGSPKSGGKIQGLCSMGMYSFTLNVN